MTPVCAYSLMATSYMTLKKSIKKSGLFLTQVGSFLGGARYVTNQERGGEWIKDTISVDRDIAFNYAYYSNEFSRLSFYKIAARTGSQCFYLKELEALRCFGAEH